MFTTIIASFLGYKIMGYFMEQNAKVARLEREAKERKR